MGIEPTCSAWKADILPLNYTCDCQTFVNQPLNYITERAFLSRAFFEKTKNYQGRQTAAQTFFIPKPSVSPSASLSAGLL